jgi:hypothetical protein
MFIHLRHIYRAQITIYVYTLTSYLSCTNHDLCLYTYVIFIVHKSRFMFINLRHIYRAQITIFVYTLTSYLSCTNHDFCLHSYVIFIVHKSRFLLIQLRHSYRAQITIYVYTVTSYLSCTNHDLFIQLRHIYRAQITKMIPGKEIKWQQAHQLIFQQQHIGNKNSQVQGGYRRRSGYTGRDVLFTLKTCRMSREMN